jgi:multiple sugar transport system ATP-binding protein
LGLPATVVLAEHLGDASIYHCQVEGMTTLVNVKVSSDRKYHHQDTLGLRVNPNHILGFDDKGQRI